MSDRSKQWQLIVAGAVFGSLSTVALLKLFNRYHVKQHGKSMMTQGSTENGTNGKASYEDLTRNFLGSDLLADEIVSEQLTRWDKSKPATVSNLILIKFTEADAHESTTLDQIKEEEPEFYTMVIRVLNRAEIDFAL